MIFLFLEKPFKKKQKKRHRSQDFLFSSSWLPNTGKQGMQTWCNTFLTSSTIHQTVYYHRLPIFCFSLLPRFQDSSWWKRRGKKTVNTTNLRQPRRLLMLNLLKTCPSFPPPLPNLHFHSSVLCVLFFFFSKWNLFTQIVAFLYVAYKQREVSICAYTNFLLNNDLISLERWDDLILEQNIYS